MDFILIRPLIIALHMFIFFVCLFVFTYSFPILSFRCFFFNQFCSKYNDNPVKYFPLKVWSDVNPLKRDDYMSENYLFYSAYQEKSLGSECSIWTIPEPSELKCYTFRLRNVHVSNEWKGNGWEGTRKRRREKKRGKVRNLKEIKKIT